MLVALVAVWAVALAELAWLLPGGRSDDAEILLHTQAWAWGYRLRNPPLFDWLAWAGMQVVGPTPVVVFALRLGCIAGIAWLLWRLARGAGLGAAASLCAALAWTWAVQFSYYALVDLTHTMLAGVFYVATVGVVWWARRSPSVPRMALLGLVVGLGLLTKYVYLLFVAAALLACWRLTAYRRLLAPGRLAVAMAVALLVVAPHAWWFVQQGPQALAGQQRESLQTADNWTALATLSGLGAWAGYAAAVLLPWVCVGALCLGRAAWAVLRGPGAWGSVPLSMRAPDAGANARDAAGEADDARWLLRTVGGTLLAVALVVVVLGAARVRPHHLIFLVLAPLAVLLHLRQAQAALEPAMKRLAALSVLWVAALLVAFAFDARGSAQRCRLCGPYIDYAALADDLRARGVEGGTLYYASAHRLLNPPMLRGYLDVHLVKLDVPLSESPGGATSKVSAVLWMPAEDQWVTDPAVTARLPAALGRALAEAQVQGPRPEQRLSTSLRTAARAGQPLAVVVVPGR